MEEKWLTDYPASERYPHYTRANAGEVLPTPASPFGQTYAFDNAIGLGFQEASIVMGAYEEDDYRDGKPEIQRRRLGRASSNVVRREVRVKAFSAHPCMCRLPIPESQVYFAA